MATVDGNGKPDEAGQHANNIHIGIRLIIGALGVVTVVYGAFKLPNEFKLVILGLVALFWVIFELIKPVRTTTLSLVRMAVQQKQDTANETDRKVQTPVVREMLGGLLLVFLLGWGYGKWLEPPTVPETVYYMVVLDASDAMKEPFDAYPSKWTAVRKAFQKFYDRSHPDSNYGLVLIGGQNPQERNSMPCSMPSVSLIPVVSENGKALSQKKLTLMKLQEQVEGQQPQGGGSLSRAFFLAKNQLESLPSETSKVIVLIANASDTCEGKIDWDTLASEIELVNNSIAIRKELILLDVEATQEVTAFAEHMNAMDEATGASNTFIQVVQTYIQLELSITYMVERNQAVETALEITATAEHEKEPVLIPATGGKGPSTPVVIPPKITATRRLVVAASATSTPSLTPTVTSTFTPTLTFTPTTTFTDIPSSTCTDIVGPATVPTTDRPTKDKTKNPTKPSPTDEPSPQRCGAVCIDGYISSSTGSGTCASHDGVKEWLYPPNCPGG